MLSGDRKLKKIALKTRYLREELYDVEEEFERHGWQLQRAVIELFARIGETKALGMSEPNTQQDTSGPIPTPAPEPESEPAVVTSWQKNLFRKIAAKTHPDSLVNADLSEREKSERAQMFIDSRRALTAADGMKLIGIAAELDIDTDDAPVEEQVSSMESLAADLENRISEIKKTAAWFWGEGHRQEMLIHIANVKGMKSPSTDIINGVLAWVDGGFIGGVATTVVQEPERRRARSTRKIGERPERIIR